MAKRRSPDLFDNLEPQVHGQAAQRPAYLAPEHTLVRGDIRDPDALAPLVRDVDVIVHLAAMVGVGQSMYQPRRYTKRAIALGADRAGGVAKGETGQ